MEVRLVHILREAQAPPAPPAELVEAHLSALRSGTDVLKDKHGSAVTRISVGDVELCVKQYRRKPQDRFKDLVRDPPAVRAWRAAEVLRRHGLATPETVCLLEHAGEHYLVTRFLAHARALNEFLVPDGLPLLEKRALVRRLGAWLADVHAAGVYHDDCSAKNIFVERAGDDWRFYLLDLDGLRPDRRPGHRRRVKNLAQLVDPPGGLGTVDCLRLLHAYAKDDAGAISRLAREVRAAALRRRRRRLLRIARNHRRAQRRGARADRKGL